MRLPFLLAAFAALMATTVLAAPIDVTTPASTHLETREPAKKGHFGLTGSGEGNEKREASPEPVRKGHFGLNGGGDGNEKRDALPEPVRKGHFGKSGNGSGDD
jgi:hypothetical protein